MHSHVNVNGDRRGRRGRWRSYIVGSDCDGSSVAVSSGSDLRHLHLHQDVGVTTMLTRALGLKLSFVRYARRRFLGRWLGVCYSGTEVGVRQSGHGLEWLESRDHGECYSPKPWAGSRVPGKTASRRVLGSTEPMQESVRLERKRYTAF